MSNNTPGSSSSTERSNTDQTRTSGDLLEDGNSHRILRRNLRKRRLPNGEFSYKVLCQNYSTQWIQPYSLDIDIWEMIFSFIESRRRRQFFDYFFYFIDREPALGRFSSQTAEDYYSPVCCWGIWKTSKFILPSISYVEARRAFYGI